MEIGNKYLDGNVFDAWKDIKKIAQNITFNDIANAIESDETLNTLFNLNEENKQFLDKIKKKGDQKLYSINTIKEISEKIVKDKKAAAALTIVIVTAGVTVAILSSQLNRYKKKYEHKKHRY